VEFNFKTWEELLDISSNYKKIIITGCQRSGTTYTASILAECLEYIHYDERDFKVDRTDLFEEILNRNELQVIQASAILHRLKIYDGMALIVVLHRDINDVERSMLAHDWFKNNGRFEWSKFSKDFTQLNPSNLYKLKIEFSKNFNNKIDLQYDELKKTNKFVYDRKNWGIKQIS
jgi:hypothetical protein